MTTKDVYEGEIVGVEDADKIRKDLWNMLNSREKVNDFIYPK